MSGRNCELRIADLKTYLLIIISTIYFIQTKVLLDRISYLERPYKEKYQDLSDIQLVFAVEDEYGRMMHYLDLGGQGWEEMYKFLQRMYSYLDELRHREVGDIQVVNERQAVITQDYMKKHEDTGYH